MGAFLSLIHSGLEEYYWRWFVFGRLQRLIRPGRAIAVSALSFMLHHVLLLAVYFGWTSPATWLFSAAVAVGGAYWAWLYRRSGSLYGAWLSHLLIDAAIFTVGYDLVAHRFAS
jgi:membrane protease YdiL (CAAX protease family)